MIETAEEFVRLRTSDIIEEQHRATDEEMPLHVYYEVIEKFPEWKEWVAHNKKVPLEVLQSLIYDPDWRVRATVARKNKLDPDSLRKLSTDSDESIRHHVAIHKNTPQDVLYILEKDTITMVSDAAKRSIERRKNQT